MMIGSSSYVVAVLCAMATTAAGFAPPAATHLHLSLASKLQTTSTAATMLHALPPQKPLNEYVSPTMVPPYFGYDLTDSSKGINQIEITGYVVGAPIDDLFKTASDFTEDSAMWNLLIKDFPQPVYRSGNPNGVGDIRDFVWESSNNQYVEMLTYSDPDAHTFVYTLHASATIGYTLNSCITYVSFVDEPDKNRVKVIWRGIFQPGFPFPAFAIKKGQTKAMNINIETLQKLYPVEK
jgi:hypothetical protein